MTKILRELSKFQKEEFIDYFGEKAVKRMKDFAIYNHKEPIQTRGQTCLDQFRKNSNREWAQRFFMLNLECWKHWFDWAAAFPNSKGAKKIMKNSEYLDKNKVVLPENDHYYNELLPGQPVNSRRDSMNGSRLANSIHYGSNSAPNNPQAQNPAQNNAQNPSNIRSNANPGQSSTSRPVKRYEESSVREKLVLIKKTLKETVEILGMAEEYENYFSDVLENAELVLRGGQDMLKAVSEGKDNYSAGTWASASHLHRVTGTLPGLIQEMIQGKIKFENFKTQFFKVAYDLEPTGGGSSETGQEAPHRSANIPKRGDQPITNHDMNSFISNPVNERAMDNRGEEEEDDIRLPEDEGEDLGEYGRPAEGKGKNEQGFGGKFDGFEEEDEEEGERDDRDKGYQEAEEFDDDFKYQEDEFQGDENNEEDHRYEPDKGEEIQEEVEEDEGEKAEDEKKFVFRFGDQAEEEDEKEDEKDNAPTPIRTRGASEVETLKSRKDSLQTVGINWGKEKKEIEEERNEDRWDDNWDEGKGNHEKENGKGDSEFGIPEVQSEKSLEVKKDGKVPKKGSTVVTEEEKIRMVQENQKKLADPSTQVALNDFFSKEDEKPKSDLFGANDIFARAKLKMKKNEPKEVTKDSEKPVSKPIQASSKVLKKQEEVPHPLPVNPAARNEDKVVSRQTAPVVHTSTHLDSQKAIHTSSDFDPFSTSNLPKKTTQKESKPSHPENLDNNNDDEVEEDNYFDTGDFFNQNSANGAIEEGFGNGEFVPEWKTSEEGRQGVQERDQEDDDQEFHDVQELDGEVEKEMEEYLRGKNRQDIAEGIVENDEHNMFAERPGGLLEDAEDEYFAPLNIEKMKEDIARIERERQKKESVKLESPQNQAPKTHKNLSPEPATPKKIDLETRAAMYRIEPKKQEIFEKYQAPDSSQKDRVSRQEKLVKNGNEGLLRQLSGKNNQSQSEVFGKSDFFNDYGSPDKLRVTSGIVRQNQQAIKHQTDESNFFQNSIIHSVAKGPIETAPEYKEVMEVKRENEHLKRENFVLANEKRTLDKKLEEIMNVTVKKMKEEQAQNESRSMAMKLGLLENDLKLAENEKSIYMQKYKELYTKFKCEKEAERETSGLIDPRKILELSKMASNLSHEKEILESQLAEERQKTAFLDTLKEELDRTRAELAVKAKMTANFDASQVAGFSQNSVLGPLKIQQRDEASFGITSLPLPRNTEEERIVNSEHPITQNDPFFQEKENRVDEPSTYSNLKSTQNVPKNHDFVPHTISRVAPEAEDLGNLDDSDLDFLANFQKEYQTAMESIKKIGEKPYQFSSHHHRDSRRNPNYLQNEIDNGFKGRPSNLFNSGYITRHSHGNNDHFDKSVDIEVNRWSLKEEVRGNGIGARDRNFDQKSFYQANPSKVLGGMTRNSREPRSSSNSAERLDFLRTNPQLDGGNFGSRPHFKGRINPGILEPFNTIYNDIPLPRKQVKSFVPSQMRDSGISEIRTNPVFFDEDRNTKAKLDRSSFVSHPDLKRREDMEISVNNHPTIKAVTMKNSQFSEPTKQNHIHSESKQNHQTRPFPEARNTHLPRPPNKSAPPVQTFSQLADFTSENLLNFKAASVFEKATLFTVKKNFQIEIESLPRSSPQDPILNFTLTIKSLSPHLSFKTNLLQKNSKIN